MIRLWNRLIRMSDDGINKKVFLWSKVHGSPWAVELYSIFEELDLCYIYQNNLCCSLNIVKIKLKEISEAKWSRDIALKAKLRTYLQIKHCFGSEPYVTCRLSRNQRSLVAQFRTGILPLAIEVGRFHNILEENRLCEFCDLHEIENESHFLLYCPKYEDLRISWFQIFFR